MEELSVSVSMANPFVEEDIRLLVRSTLRSDPKFRRWPQELLDEVERALPAGAKGMYVCRSYFAAGVFISLTLRIGFAGRCARLMPFED